MQASAPRHCHPDGRRYRRPWRAPCPGVTDASNHRRGHKPSQSLRRDGFAQSPAPDQTIRDWQNQLAEMRSQMVTMRNTYHGDNRNI